MWQTPIQPDDLKLLEIACDVAIRLRGHWSYGNTIEGAIKALRRRAPGHTPDKYRAVLEFLCKVYDRAAEVIPMYPAQHHVNTTGFAQFEDIDYTACMRELNRIKPGVALKEKRCILNWCIFWCYLK